MTYRLRCKRAARTRELRRDTLQSRARAIAERLYEQAFGLHGLAYLAVGISRIAGTEVKP